MAKKTSLLERIKKKLHNNRYYVYILLGGGMIIGVIAFIQQLDKGVQLFKSKEKIKVVDVSVEHKSDTGTVMKELVREQTLDTLSVIKTRVMGDDGTDISTRLDVKLRNPGNSVVFLKEVIFTVNRIWKFHELDYHCPAGDGLSASGSYNLSIDLDRATPYTIKKKISQVVNANSVDRFFFNLRKVSDHTGNYVVHMSMSLIYNENDQKLKLPDILLFIQDEINMECWTWYLDKDVISNINSYRFRKIIKKEFLEKPEIQDSMARYHADQLYDTVDVSDELVRRYEENYRNLHEIQKIDAIWDDLISFHIQPEAFSLNPKTIKVMKRKDVDTIRVFRPFKRPNSIEEGFYQ